MKKILLYILVLFFATNLSVCAKTIKIAQTTALCNRPNDFSMFISWYHMTLMKQNSPIQKLSNKTFILNLEIPVSDIQKEYQEHLKSHVQDAKPSPVLRVN